MSEEAPSLDLSAFDFGPAWAKAKSPSAPSAGEPASRKEWTEPRPPRRDDRRQRPNGPMRGKVAGRERGPLRGGKPRPEFHGPRREEKPAPPPNPFPWLRIAFTATEPAVETVVKQVRQTGKTFSLFDIARILLRNPASYNLDLTSAPKQPEGPFYVVTADRSVWMTMENAVRHILRKELENFYRVENVEVEPPKGNFSVIAVCGMSGTLLGPPNLHDYERRLRELHREKFGRMDFEQYRSRLKMERDPEVIEKWRAAASKAVEYYPKDGENPERLDGIAAVEKHFIAHQASALVEFVGTCSVPGDPRTAKVDPALAPLLNYARDEEFRFPLRLAQGLSRALSAAGLRFHKSANRTTFVSASRPRHLDLAEVAVSDSIRKIIETIRAKKNIRRHQLLDLLAPLPKKTPPLAEPAESTASPVTPETSQTPETLMVAETAGPVAKSPEEIAREAVVQDLLWLTHEGYVIEYGDSRLESVPPPKNSPKKAEEQTPAVTEAAAPAPDVTPEAVAMAEVQGVESESPRDL
jgi:hypothetical protein